MLFTPQIIFLNPHPTYFLQRFFTHNVILKYIFLSQKQFLQIITVLRLYQAKPFVN